MHKENQKAEDWETIMWCFLAGWLKFSVSFLLFSAVNLNGTAVGKVFKRRLEKTLTISFVRDWEYPGKDPGILALFLCSSPGFSCTPLKSGYQLSPPALCWYNQLSLISHWWSPELDPDENKNNFWQVLAKKKKKKADSFSKKNLHLGLSHLNHVIAGGRRGNY